MTVPAVPVATAMPRTVRMKQYQGQDFMYVSEAEDLVCIFFPSLTQIFQYTTCMCIIIFCILYLQNSATIMF